MTEKEVGKVVYVQICSERADCKDTLVRRLSIMHQIIIRNLGYKWLIAVGDVKTYDLLQSIRFEYGSHLRWLIPFPGDWHILLNYQKVLMKVYADAGLIQLGSISGHRAETRYCFSALISEEHTTFAVDHLRLFSFSLFRCTWQKSLYRLKPLCLEACCRHNPVPLRLQPHCRHHLVPLRLQPRCRHHLVPYSHADDIT